MLELIEAIFINRKWLETDSIYSSIQIPYNKQQLILIFMVVLQTPSLLNTQFIFHCHFSTFNMLTLGYNILSRFIYLHILRRYISTYILHTKCFSTATTSVFVAVCWLACKLDMFIYTCDYVYIYTYVYR